MEITSDISGGGGGNSSIIPYTMIGRSPQHHRLLEDSTVLLPAAASEEGPRGLLPAAPRLRGSRGNPLASGGHGASPRSHTDEPRVLVSHGCLLLPVFFAVWFYYTKKTFRKISGYLRNCPEPRHRYHDYPPQQPTPDASEEHSERHRFSSSRFDSEGYNQWDDVLRKAHRRRTRSEDYSGGASAERLVKWINRRNVRRRQTQHDLRSTTQRVLQQQQQQQQHCHDHQSNQSNNRSCPRTTTTTTTTTSPSSPSSSSPLGPQQQQPLHKDQPPLLDPSHMGSLLDDNDDDEESYATNTTSATHKSNRSRATLPPQTVIPYEHDDDEIIVSDEPSPSQRFASSQETMLRSSALHWECLPEIGDVELCTMSASAAAVSHHGARMMLTDSPPVSPIPSEALDGWPHDHDTASAAPSLPRVS